MLPTMLPIALPIVIAATTWTYKDNKVKKEWHAIPFPLSRQKKPAAVLLSTITTCADIGIGSRTLSLCRRHVGDWFACRMDSHVHYCLQRRHERHIGAYRLDAGNNAITIHTMPQNASQSLTGAFTQCSRSAIRSETERFAASQSLTLLEHTYHRRASLRFGTISTRDL